LLSQQKHIDEGHALPCPSLHDAVADILRQ
jgi:hypothetical protein